MYTDAFLFYSFNNSCRKWSLTECYAIVVADNSATWTDMRVYSKNDRWWTDELRVRLTVLDNKIVIKRPPRTTTPRVRPVSGSVGVFYFFSFFSFSSRVFSSYTYNIQTTAFIYVKYQQYFLPKNKTRWSRCICDFEPAFVYGLSDRYRTIRLSTCWPGPAGIGAGEIYCPGQW